ncbi:MAG: hypothetical protein KDA77_00290 [Planctomycetaceae bacterium]|nr:hypothetical protein [Planctomycetaceae bacterium]
MRKSLPKEIRKCRVRTGHLASDDSFGMTGQFLIPYPGTGVVLRVISSDGSGWDAQSLGPDAWEHVSVSLQARTPTWDEMDFVKRLFWKDSETVLQLHVPRDQHINFTETCLHLWRPKKLDVPLPPARCV